MEYSEQFGIQVVTTDLRPVRVAYWPASGWQVDEQFERILGRIWSLDLGLLGKTIGSEKDFSEEARKDPKLLHGRSAISRVRDLGDSIMMAIVLAPFTLTPIQFTDLGRLRLQECERVFALRTEL